MGSGVGKILKVAAPVVLSFALPGLGTAIGAGLGATTAIGQAALGGAVLGAGTGLLSGGGVKGALMGAATGGIGGAVSGAGGFGAAAEKLGMGTVGTAARAGTGLAGAIGSASNKFGSVVGGLSNFLGSGSGGAASAGAGIGNALFQSPSVAGAAVPAASGGGFNALANIYSGIQGTMAAKDAAKAQLGATNQALALQSKMYDQTTANMKPYLTSGNAANTQLSTLLGLQGDPNAEGYGSLTKKFTMDDFQADPGYQFRLQEGTKAMNQTLGARGSLFSGEALKSAQQFGQDTANNAYNDAYTRYVQDQNNAYVKLNNASASGQNAAAQQGGIGQQYANTAGGLMQDKGNIQANSLNAQNTAVNQGLAGILGSSYNFTSQPFSSIPQQGYYQDQLGNKYFNGQRIQ